MTQFIAYDGTSHDVSPAQKARLDAAFGDEWPSRDEADALRKLLLVRSERNHRNGELPLTAQEERILRACDEVWNMNNAYRLMKGRDYREVFGSNATIDQIHLNSIHAPCGCIVNHIFDHNTRDQEERDHYPHFSTRACEAHAHHGADFKAHYSAVTGEKAS